MEKDNWQRCPRCESARTLYRGSRLQFIVMGVIFFIAGYFYGIPSIVNFLYSANNELMLGAEDLIASGNLQVGFIAALVLVPLYYIAKPLRNCKDCSHMWN